ncbi:secreted protein [Beutenbergia cavernae DSM 12333]|uniref:Secreted protein n=1 Tax=Beutenbergia cavernae (strain ATCC BAA-8 / DSM 12333 / CCUG 43141 / JCM 11478 / NBRC 16432 / NCIMB 13614 / HKI 0122) TaxID=471853 RepID=C5BY67_BEUC1|nr:FAD-dependent oxidoreductase [Beutenbergia cavernae]ACQ80967.1 secreted protein [Beutenbergia cavernae DSM 12333]
MTERSTEVLVVGGGLGGVAAALTAARLGRRVVLTEETDWLGGQLTAQLVPPDEHAWIETDVVSPSYADLRTRIRDYYRRAYPLTPEAAVDPMLNPGRGKVSRLCHEPRVAVAVLDELLAPWRASGAIDVLMGYVPVAVHTDGDVVEAVTLRDAAGDELTVTAPYVVDATELGDLLELGGVEHVVGAESRDETGELHAPAQADPLDQQAVSWCFALEHRPGEDHTIDRPASYSHWASHVAPFWPGPQLSWTDVEPVSLRLRDRPIFMSAPTEGVPFDLWAYRRILSSEVFDARSGIREVSVVNWPQIDYWEAPLLGVSDSEAARALEASRDLSLAFLYWMQTDAPREDGGTGYPGLRLRPDVAGTADGLAKAAYIREARRIRAEFTVLEQHVGTEARGIDAGSALFADAVGIGHYRIDLHPSTAGRTYVDVASFPFQIPLGSLLPVRVENLLPACKNIGTTHITNGAYRLHPVEWSIGEAVGALAAFSLDRGIAPRKVRADAVELADYQALLTDTLGITLAWPEQVRTHRPAY